MEQERKKGNRTIERRFTLADGFTIFDLMNRKKGYCYVERWGDKPYRSIWINPKEKTVFTYCEGDVTRVICDNQVAFLDELRENNEFYKQFGR